MELTDDTTSLTYDFFHFYPQFTSLSPGQECLFTWELRFPDPDLEACNVIEVSYTLAVFPQDPLAVAGPNPRRSPNFAANQERLYEFMVATQVLFQPTVRDFPFPP